MAGPPGREGSPGKDVSQGAMVCSGGENKERAPRHSIRVAGGSPVKDME